VCCSISVVTSNQPDEKNKKIIEMKLKLKVSHISVISYLLQGKI